MNKNIKEMIEYPKQGIISKEVIKSGKLNVTLFCMAKNTEMSEHTSTRSGTVYVVEWKGVFNLEGKNIKMVPGAYIHMEKNQRHSLKSRENTSFLLTLVK